MYWLMIGVDVWGSSWLLGPLMDSGYQCGTQWHAVPPVSQISGCWTHGPDWLRLVSHAGQDSLTVLVLTVILGLSGSEAANLDWIWISASGKRLRWWGRYKVVPVQLKKLSAAVTSLSGQVSPPLLNLLLQALRFEKLRGQNKILACIN